MIMTGQMTKYKESLRHMPEPIMLSQIQKSGFKRIDELCQRKRNKSNTVN